MVLFTPTTTFNFAGWKFRLWSEPTPMGMSTIAIGGCVCEVVVLVVTMELMVVVVVCVEDVGVVLVDVELVFDPGVVVVGPDNVGR